MSQAPEEETVVAGRAEGQAGAAPASTWRLCRTRRSHFGCKGRRRKRRMELHRAWLTLLLLALQTSGTACDHARNPPSQVNGILGGSASFSMKLSSEKTLSKLEWTFQNKFGRKLHLAEFRNGTWKWSKARDWFGQRLEIAEIANIATLRIKDLKMEDSGEYEAVMTHSTKEKQVYTFNLTVYEPVPEPELRIIPPHPQQATGGYDVTLQCQVTGKGGFSVSWKTGNPLRNLNKSSNWYQLSANGRDLHLLWWPNSSDSTFTCLVSNAVDQKSASFDLRSICPNEGTSATGLPWLSLRAILIVVGLVVQITAVASLSILERREQHQR